MSHFRLLRTLAIAGVGAGSFIAGTNYKSETCVSCKDTSRLLVTSQTEDGSTWEKFLPSAPVVHAASSLIPAGGISDVLSTNNVNANLFKFGNPGGDNVLKMYDDFVLSYDRRNRTALWVFEHLNRDKVLKNDSVKRDQCKFVEDQTVHAFFRSSNSDYKGTGYDRGHMSPAANHRWSQNAMNQTFVLTNIVPQVGLT